MSSKALLGLTVVALASSVGCNSLLGVEERFLTAGGNAGLVDDTDPIGSGGVVSNSHAGASRGGAHSASGGASGAEANGDAGTIDTPGGANAGGAGNGAAGNGTAGHGTAGSGAGGTPGAAGSGMGGTPGAAGSAGSGPLYDVPRGNSVGCNKSPGSDSSTAYTVHDVDIPQANIDSTFAEANPPVATAAPYTWTHRNYSVRLPTGYVSSKAYPVILQGGGCGASNGLSGSTGAYPSRAAGQTDAIQIGLSYVNACFADDTAKTPEVAYFDAVMKDVESRLCVDLSKVFGAGTSSGASEMSLFGCPRAGVIRGFGMASGWIRTDRPACSKVPVAAMYIVGENDTVNTPAATALGRNEVLARNGCVGTATAPWDIAFPICLKYTGCPAAFPVVWCLIPGGGHQADMYDGVKYGTEGFWHFFSSLPAVP